MRRSNAEKLLESILNFASAEVNMAAEGNSGEFSNAKEQKKLRKELQLQRAKFADVFQNTTDWKPIFDPKTETWSLDRKGMPADEEMVLARNSNDRDGHTEHCCVLHGCKYCKPNCTVVTGKKVQSYTCEDCDTEESGCY